MILLGYVGNHSGESIITRLGYGATRLVQRGEFCRVTHVEAYYGTDDSGLSIIGSSSIRDGGVRVKSAKLDLRNWVAIDVPIWDAKKSRSFMESLAGSKYDLLGAVATVFLGRENQNRWFCSEVIGASVGIVSPELFGPAQLMAIAMSMPGSKITTI